MIVFRLDGPFGNKMPQEETANGVLQVEAQGRSFWDVFTHTQEQANRTKNTLRPAITDSWLLRFEAMKDEEMRVCFLYELKIDEHAI